jgi:serine/threonine-protein kinase
VAEERARTLLANSGLRVADVNRIYSTDVAEGRVISCSPPPGTPLRRNQSVTLVVSSGPEPVAIPSVVGATVDQATAALQPLGLDIKTDEQFSDTVPKGTVISQDPAPGQGHRGDRITLVVSRGPEFVQVPGVLGQNDEAATKALEDAGFKVEVHKNAAFVNAHIVVGETPPGGQTARVGTTVVIEIV